MQNNLSLKLLNGVNYYNVTVAGDPRIDRVLTIAEEKKHFPDIQNFCGNSPVLVAGSTWPKDEKIIYEWWRSPQFQHWKLILAPHDIALKRIVELQQLFGEAALTYSELNQVERINAPSRLLIIDSIGQLSALYQFGRVAYVGGGFGSGIHNTLEPMAFNLPVLYGPKYQKFTEAIAMIQEGGHISISSSTSLINQMLKFQEEEQLRLAKQTVASYMKQYKGASKTIFQYVDDYL